MESAGERGVLQKEEIFNTLTHAVGLVLASIGLIFLTVRADGENMVAVVVYGTTLVLLYLASTLYHAVTHARVKSLFRVLDHIGIFLLIAGTYTPFCLIALRGGVGPVLLLLVWVLAIAGLILKIFFTGRHDVLSTLLYLALGWMVIVVLRQVYQSITLASFVLLVIGGVCYSSGVLFYRMSGLRYHHGIWHLFVLGGSASHFVSILALLG